jgi:hypothetical protein
MKKLILATFFFLVIGLFSFSILSQGLTQPSLHETNFLEVTQKAIQAQDGQNMAPVEETKSKPKQVITSAPKQSYLEKGHLTKATSGKGREIEFTPDLGIDLSNHYHYQSTSIWFTLTQDETEKEVKSISAFFNKGFFDIDLHEEGDIIGFGHMESSKGDITYEITVSDKFTTFYNLDYKIVDSSNPYYVTGNQGMYGILAKTGDNMNFTSFKLFEGEDDNNLTDTINHFISLTDGVFRNPEPGIMEVEKTFESMDYEIFSEIQKIEIQEFTSSYCSLMQGMFEVAYNSEIGDENYDGRLDVYEDETVNIQDLAVFAANHEDEFWCAYQITPL